MSSRALVLIAIIGIGYYIYSKPNMNNPNTPVILDLPSIVFPGDPDYVPYPFPVNVPAGASAEGVQDTAPTQPIQIRPAPSMRRHGPDKSKYRT